MNTNQDNTLNTHNIVTFSKWLFPIVLIYFVITNYFVIFFLSICHLMVFNGTKNKRSFDDNSYGMSFVVNSINYMLLFYYNHQ